jgi:hypothetical protein
MGRTDMGGFAQAPKHLDSYDVTSGTRYRVTLVVDGLLATTAEPLRTPALLALLATSGWTNVEPQLVPWLDLLVEDVVPVLDYDVSLSWVFRFVGTYNGPTGPINTIKVDNPLSPGSVPSSVQFKRVWQEGAAPMPVPMGPQPPLPPLPSPPAAPPPPIQIGPMPPIQIPPIVFTQPAAPAPSPPPEDNTLMFVALAGLGVGALILLGSQLRK